LSSENNVSALEQAARYLAGIRPTYDNAFKLYRLALAAYNKAIQDLDAEIIRQSSGAAFGPADKAKLNALGVVRARAGCAHVRRLRTG
jgi:hypothetical protein